MKNLLYRIFHLNKEDVDKGNYEKLLIIGQEFVEKYAAILGEGKYDNVENKKNLKNYFRGLGESDLASADIGFLLVQNNKQLLSNLEAIAAIFIEEGTVELMAIPVAMSETIAAAESIIYEIKQMLDIFPLSHNLLDERLKAGFLQAASAFFTTGAQSDSIILYPFTIKLIDALESKIREITQQLFTLNLRNFNSQQRHFKPNHNVEIIVAGIQHGYAALESIKSLREGIILPVNEDGPIYVINAEKTSPSPSLNKLV